MDVIDQKLIKELQDNIPLTENPYRTLADLLGVSEDEIIKRLTILKETGKLKRIGAILRHQKSGYNANAMVVFKVPEATIEEIGRILAQSSLVSHCYERKAYPQWPYNLYAMLHSTEASKIEEFVRAFTATHAIQVYDILFSQEELKKTSMTFSALC